MEASATPKGLNKSPYIEVTDHEYTESSRWVKGLSYLALGGIGLTGVRFASNLTINMDPRRLSYLTEGLGPWWEVAGYSLDTEGKTPIRVRDFMLEGVKRFEELMGGIPRTFGLFGYASRGTLTTPSTQLIIPPEALRGARSHYDELLREAGHSLTDEDIVRGLEVRPYEGRPALFRVGESTPLIEGVDVQARRWQVEAPGLRDAEGNLRYQHIVRESEAYSSTIGARPISHKNEFRYLVTKASGRPKIRGALRDTLGHFIDVDALESRVHIPEGVHRGVQTGQVFAKRMSERYLRILDQPLEFIEEIIYGGPTSEQGLLRRTAESKPYSFFRNLLGTGGDYSGTALDLWGRHISRLIPLTIGAAAIYEGGSAVTNLLFDKDLSQVGGEVVAATQRTYAGVSDITGLTALSQYQEEKAEGSQRLSGVLAFPLSGALTGWVAAGLTNRMATPEGTSPWVHARQKAHAAPEILQKAQRVPLLGKLFGTELTRGAKFAGIGGTIGGVLSLPFLLGALGSTESYEETTAIQSGAAEVPIRKGRGWEFGKCHAADGKIKTGYIQYKNAENLIVGDYAIGSDGELHEIKYKTSREHSGTIISVTTALDRTLKTRLTDNHIVPIVRAGRYKEEGEVGSLELRDMVQVPIPKLDNDLVEVDLLDYIKVGRVLVENDKIYPAQQNWYTKRIQRSSEHPVPRRLQLDHDIGLLFGYFLAKGNLTFRKNKLTYIETVHAISESWIVQDIERICRERFGINIKVKHRPDYKGAIEGVYIVRILSTVLARVFFELFYSSSRSVDKHCPEILLSGTDDFKHGVVEGYWRGDGYIDRGRRVITSTQKQLLEFIQLILLDKGICPTIVLHEDDERYKTSFRISWDDSQTPYSNRQSFLWIDDKLFVQVVGIDEEEYDGLVYDFEIDSEDHLLQQGCFLVHNSDIEGEGELIYTEGWYRRLMNEGIEELEHGDYGDRPLSRMIKGITDPYYMEKETYYDRPYPMATADDSFGGPLGPLWATTIGRVFKPPKYMHADELSPEGVGGVAQGEVIQYGEDYSEAPVSDLGGLGPTPSTTPTSPGFLAGESVYRASEAIGLPGYLLSEITGSDEWGTSQPVLESSAEIGSMRGSFWDWEIGGGYTATESVRRFLPKGRREVQTVNPIANQMPHWMPGADYFAGSFQEGDPYSGRRMLERLPGPGFEARFPELKGVPYEDYPDIFRYKILADVARYSDEFSEVAKQIEVRADAGELSERDYALYAGTKAQLLEKEKKLNFRGEAEGLMGSYWSALTSVGRLNPAEHLLPISPVHKFSGPVSAIQTYEEREVYSTESPQWSSPLSDFILPAARSAGKIAGMDSIPESVQEERSLKQYFDVLEYTKYKKLEAAARDQDEGRAAFSYARKAEFTMFGADPYADIETIEKIIPREERPYFREFVATDDPETRRRILSATPAYTRKFYMAQWQKKLYASLAAKGEMTEDEEQIAAAIEASRALEGQSATRDEFYNYYSGVQQEAIRPNTFPDFIRARRLEGYFDNESPFDAPPSDWLAYNPSVDMDSVKLRVVESLGCVLPEQLLHTSWLDLVKAEDIADNTKLLSVDGKEHIVKHIHKGEYSGRVFKIRLSGYKHREIAVTENHIIPILRQSSGEYKFKEVAAKDIRTGQKPDKILFPKLNLTEQTTTIDVLDILDNATIDKKNNSKVRLKNGRKSIYRFLDPVLLGEFLGWYLAKGSVCASKAVCMDLDVTEEDVACRLRHITMEIFGVEAKIKRPKGCFQVKIHSKIIAMLCERLCGKLSKNKRIDNSILAWPKKALVALAMGWHKGNGWDDGKQIHFSTISDVLAHQMWWILNSLGGRTRMSVIPPRKTTFGLSSTEYRLSIGVLEHKEALKKGEVPTYTPETNLTNGNNFFWFGVKEKIEEFYNGIVYDFTMPKDAYYLTECGLIHNSDHHDFDLWEDTVAQAEREPYAEAAAQELMSGADSEDHTSLAKSLIAMRLSDVDVEFSGSGSDKTRIVLDLQMDKRQQIREQLERQGVRYGVS